MINVRIKLLPPDVPGGEPRAVTQRVFLRPGAEMAKGCRPLEPGEVVALEDDGAREAIRKLPFELEIAEDPPTRPLYFRNADEARMTSDSFNPNTAGRVEAAKEAMKRMLEDAQSENAQVMMDAVNDLERREAAIRAREIELGLVDAPPDEAALDDDLQDYVPENNAMTTAELKEIREKAAAEREAEGAEAAEPPKQRRRRRAG